MSATEPRPGFVPRIVGAMLYGAVGLAFVYAAVNDLLQGRAGVFELIWGALGLAAVVIAGIYLFRSLGGESDGGEPPPG